MPDFRAREFSGATQTPNRDTMNEIASQRK